MTTQPENKDNAEAKITKDELNEEQLAKASGGTITKTVDKSSPVLFQNCVTGQHFP